MQKSDFITKDIHYRWDLYENGEFIDSFPSHTKTY